MESFYFGTNERRLYGAYHPCSPGAKGAVAAVLCHPLGSEYIPSHRALLDLARALAAGGIPTLQFDLFGCGDSGGDWRAWSLAGWVEDVTAAAQELLDGARVDDLVLVGIRLGADLCALAASGLEQVSKLVLWHPVVDGASHLVELRAMHRDWVAWSNLDLRMPGDSNSPEELLGFPLSTQYLQELRSHHLGSLQAAPVERLALLLQPDVAAQQRMAAQWREQGARLSTKTLEGVDVWRAGTDPDALLRSNSLESVIQLVLETVR